MIPPAVAPAGASYANRWLDDNEAHECGLVDVDHRLVVDRLIDPGSRYPTVGPGQWVVSEATEFEWFFRRNVTWPIATCVRAGAGRPSR